MYPQYLTQRVTVADEKQTRVVCNIQGFHGDRSPRMWPCDS
jgi:hypothetical protein